MLLATLPLLAALAPCAFPRVTHADGCAFWYHPDSRAPDRPSLLVMAMTNEERKEAVLRQRAQRAEAKERTVKRRKAAIDALRAWAELARKKQELRQQEEPSVRVSADAVADLPSEATPVVVSIIDTYRQLAVTKVKLSVLRTARDLEAVKRKLTGDRS
ncbi:hypothetical protein AB1Y20_010608 [Prymnesium parvum]|uniref:Uncharacterized protein n=1 Tax=Prymnesium parvum TaxID=97485 RepID=A0AB34IR93_PRYPA